MSFEAHNLKLKTTSKHIKFPPHPSPSFLSWLVSMASSCHLWKAQIYNNSDKSLQPQVFSGEECYALNDNDEIYIALIHRCSKCFTFSARHFRSQISSVRTWTNDWTNVLFCKKT